MREYEVKDECVSLSTLLGAIESAGNPLNIVILDACRNNPFKRSFRSTVNGLAKVDAPVGTLIAYSTAPGSVAEDGKGRNGLYTSTLLRYILVEGLPVEEVFKKTRRDVMKLSSKDQIPWESTSLTGTFVFNGEISVQAMITPQYHSSQNAPFNIKETRYYLSNSGFAEITDRFSSKNQDIVYDTYLKKKWMIIESSQTFSWKEAKKYCENNLGNNFRLPTKNELMSLITKKKLTGEWGKINSNFFPYNDRSTRYWTGEKTGNWMMGNLYWYVDFKKGISEKMLGSNYCAIIAISEGN